MEVILVDNCSVDGTAEYVRVNFPEVLVRRLDANSGYSRANNLGVRESSGEYVVLLNPDTFLERESLSRLVAPLAERDRTITVPKILSYDGSVINTCGNIEHFTGLAFTKGLGMGPDRYVETRSPNGISGACFGINREDYLSLGGFDEDFFVYMEDVEFSWRARVQGFEILYVPSSVVYHDYELGVSAGKLYHLEKGRYMILRKYYSPLGLLSILPSLMMTEMLTWGYSVTRGVDGIESKMHGLYQGLARARNSQSRRPSRELMYILDWRIPEDQLTFTTFDKLLKKAANAVYGMNRKVLIG